MLDKIKQIFLLKFLYTGFRLFKYIPKPKRIYVFTIYQYILLLFTLNISLDKYKYFVHIEMFCFII